MHRLISLKIGLLWALVVAFTAALPASAQASITIDNINLNCSSAEITYTVNAAGGNVLISAFANSVQIGGGGGSGVGVGTYVSSVEFTPQANATPITFNVSNDLGTATETATCEGSTTPPIDDNPPPSNETTPSQTDGGGSWAGDTDGRISPDRGEYYTIYCARGFVGIFRTNPDTVEVKRVAIATVEGMVVNDVLDLGDGMTLMRNSEDTLTVYGSSGNLAPEAGSKAFSRSACLAFNASASVLPNAVITNDEDGEDDEDADLAAIFGISLAGCLDILSIDFFGAPPPCYIIVPLGVLLQICLTGTIPALSVMAFPVMRFRRKPRRSRGKQS